MDWHAKAAVEVGFSSFDLFTFDFATRGKQKDWEEKAHGIHLELHIKASYPDRTRLICKDLVVWHWN